MTETAQQIVEQPQNTDLPEAPAPGSLGALKSYLVRPEVKSRLTFACNGDENKMRVLASGLYAAVETAEDPSALLACSPRSIVNAALLAMQHNLPLDGRKLAFLTPRRNKHRNETCALLTPSYHGFEYVVRVRYPDFVGRAEFVFKDDEFELLRNDGIESYIHKPANPFNDKYETAQGLFYHYTYTDEVGKRHSIVYTLPMSEVQKSKSAANKKEIWNTWFYKMALKTIVRSALSAKFKTLVQPIEELDNEHFDLNSPELKKEGVYATSEIMAVVEADRSRRGLPPLVKDAPAVALETQEKAEATQVAEEVGADVQMAIPALPQGVKEDLEGVEAFLEGEQWTEEQRERFVGSNAPQGEGTVREGEIVIEGTAIDVNEAVGEDVVVEEVASEDLWNGSDVVMPDGRIVSRQWKSPAHAGAYLAASLATVTSAEDKEQIAEQNRELLEAIKASGNEDLYNSLGEMLGYGSTQSGSLPA